MKRFLIAIIILLTMTGFRTDNDISLSGYYTNLTLSKSGTKADPIIVTGNGAHVQCLKITGNWVYVSNIVAEKCQKDGVLITGWNVRFENSTVVDNAQVNGGGGTCFGSPIYHGIVATKSPVTIKGNSVYNNCGYGIRSTTASIENNSVLNNYGVNIYGSIIKSNVSQCEYSVNVGIRVIGTINIFQNYVQGCAVGIDTDGFIFGSISENAVVNDTIHLYHHALGTTVNGNHTTYPIEVLYAGANLYDNHLFE